MLELGGRFPDPLSVQSEIVALGGDLSPATLLEAYRNGIFPWYIDGQPITWWSLFNRAVLIPSKIRISRRLERSIRKSTYGLTLDCDFEQVILSCREVYRPDQDGTWITNDMVDAYCELHELGYAHSVESWNDDGKLAGGLYGVSLGGCFSGESMFHRETDASKIAFTALVGFLQDAGFGLIDCQQPTPHLASFGASIMSREDFLSVLQNELQERTVIGSWASLFPDFPESLLWNTLRQVSH